jgi:hypothetical protein
MKNVDIVMKYLDFLQIYDRIHHFRPFLKFGQMSSKFMIEFTISGHF